MTQPNTSPQRQKHHFQKSGFSWESLIRFFFASNAGMTILILGLLITFLLKEGLGFFPGYRRELEVYRASGMEFVDLSRKNLSAHEQLCSLLNRAYYAEINGKAAHVLKRYQESTEFYNAYNNQVSPVKSLIIDNLNNGVDPNSSMIAVLKGKYETKKQQAFQDLPLTPHLSVAERQSILTFLRERKVTNTDLPPLLEAVTADYSKAQAIYAQDLISFREAIDAIESSSFDLGGIISEMTESTKAISSAVHEYDILVNNKTTLLNAAKNEKKPELRKRLIEEAEALLAEKPNTQEPLQLLMEKKASCIQLHQQLKENLTPLFQSIQQLKLTQDKAQRYFNAAQKALQQYLKDLDQAPQQIQQWTADKPVPLITSIQSFILGKEWITGGEWQDFYGILPLFTGSLMISIIALTIAIPISIASAIYINQFATRKEQTFIKPIIEFIQAIPSVVLGFMGILVFGTILRNISTLDYLSWIPGFPIDERLNIFTAGCLLALMSVPTIFSLAEDAINNVPSAYSEASEALGASKLQTVFRVIIPAAFSGILAAVLLGFGRVIGETMVVLLVAGNRIKIPDFTEGLGAFFQPAHTLTGIIAQELGEVPTGSVHYRALFIVGILIFSIVLCINSAAHRFIRKQK